MRPGLRALLTILVGAVALGCTGSVKAQDDSSPPEWFLNPNEAYSDQQHLTAVASGSSPQVATNKAFGHLARIFEADIKASETLREKYREVQKSGDWTKGQQKTQMVTQSDIRSNQQLLNSEVLKRKEVEGTHYVLVGMERMETARIYTREVEKNRKKIERYRTAAKESKRPLDRLAFLRQALVLSKANERLRTQRNIIEPGPPTSVPSSSPLTMLKKSVRDAQTDCPVVVKPKAESGRVPSTLLDQVRTSLQGVGFQVVEQSEDALLETLVSYQEKPSLPSRDEEFRRWSLTIEVTRRRTQRFLETFTAEERAGGLSETAVQRRAHRQARTVIEEEFLDFLERTLLNLNS